MSKKRSGKPFRTLGQRMLSFGRDVMRTYSNEVSIQPDTPSEPSRPQGQWRSMTNNNLIWRQEQQTPAPPPAQAVPQDLGYDDPSIYEESDYQPFAPPIQRRQQQQQPRPVQRQQQPPAQKPPDKPTPNYVQMDDGTPVKVSQKQFDSPLQRRLEAIMAAHGEIQAERDAERDKKIENIQRKVESGELSTRRRRGSIDVDYVSTDSLIAPDEREKIQAQRQAETQNNTPDTNADNDSQWFDEVPDDDADIDNIAGFESSDDSLQRLPDDLPRFDPTGLEEGDTDNDMGEFESGYEAIDSSVATDNPIDRAFDDDAYPVDDFDGNMDSFDAPIMSDTPVQRRPQDINALPTFDDFDQDETVPLVPDVDLPSPMTPATDAPIQRQALDNDAFDEGDDPSINDAPADDTPIINNRPVQRRPIQRETSDETDYPVQDFDAPTFDETSDNTTESVRPPSLDNSQPIQRRIQRTPLDSTEVDNTPDFSDYQDYGEQTWAEANNISSDTLPDITPTDSTPVQRAASDDLPQITRTDGSPAQREVFDDFANEVPDVNAFSDSDAPVQRTELEQPQVDDFGDDSDFYNEVPDVNAFSDSDTPVQRTELEQSQFDDFSDDSDFYNEVPDVNAFSDTPTSSQPTDNTPIQRTELEQPQFSDYGEDDVEFTDDADFSDMSSVDAPIQRTAFEDDEPYLDDYGFDVADTNDTAGLADNTPVQRSVFEDPQITEYSDFGEDNYNDFSDTGDFPTVNTPPSDNTPIQRQALDDNLHVDTPPADTLEINPTESLSIQPPKADTQSPQLQRTPQTNTDTPSNEPVVQRREFDRNHPDLGDGGDYQDYGDETWAEANNISSDTLPDITPTNSEPVQRTESEQPQFDDFGDETDFYNEVPDVNAFSDSDAPVQRTESEQPQFDDFGDDTDFYNEVPDVNAFSDSDAPVQRTELEQPQSADDADFYNEVPDVNAFNDSDAPVQRRLIQRQESDEPLADEPMESLSISPPADNTPVQRRPVQRQESDEPLADEPMESLSISPPADNTPVQRRPVQRQESDEPQVDEPMESLSISPPADNTPVQRQELDSTDYEDFGDQTWAQANDYSPASDVDVTDNGSSIQRDFDEARNTLPTFDDDFDGTQDTDSFTAMNILSEYVAEQNQSGETPSTNDAPIQRSTQDNDRYDYLPEGFDPTPEIYNFDAVNTDAAPTPDAPIQRSAQDDLVGDSSFEQPIDLFSALSQAGAVTSRSSERGNIQRDMQDNGADNYDDFGDQTWAEVNNYSPATDNADVVQRSIDEPSDASFEQPIDLFSALSQEGAVKQRGNSSSDNTPIQRSPQNGNNNDGLNDDMINLYNAMMDSGMIQQTDNTSYSSPTSSNPIQRDAQPPPQPEPQSVDLGAALQRATQVSESSAHNSSETSKLGGYANNQIQRDNETGTGPTSSSDQATTASTEGDDAAGKVSIDDKRYMDQLARDVFRIIKRRLREEKERRG